MTEQWHMRRVPPMRWATSLGTAWVLCCASAQWAHAQTAQTQTFTLAFDEPAQTELGNCAFRQQCPSIPEGCSLPNLANCGEHADPDTSRELEFRITTISSGTFVPTGSDRLVVWLESADVGELDTAERCTGTPDPIFHESTSANLTSARLYPDDLGAPVMRVADLYDAALDSPADACATLRSRKVRICVAVEFESGGSISISTTEPRGWLEIPVDTRSPDAPGIGEILQQDGGVDVTVDLNAQANLDDVATLEVRFREQAGADPATPCAQWPGCNTVFADLNDNQRDRTVSITALTNGTPYEFCAIATDRAGNQSVPSAVVVASPRDECDFAECFPGPVKPGYCAASPASLGTLGSIVPWIILGRRRRRQPS